MPFFLAPLLGGLGAGAGTAAAGAAAGSAASDSDGGGIGGMMSGLFGSKNKFKATPYDVDPNAYEYGGRRGFSEEEAGNLGSAAGWAQTRQGPRTDYSEANWDRYASGLARAGQERIANQMEARATGAVPSISEMQAQRDMARAAAAQASGAASARGAGAVALGQQNAAANTAAAQADISGRAQISAAQERLAAEQAASGAYGQMRGGDFQSQQLAGQRAQFLTEAELRQRALNDQQALGYQHLSQNVRNAQLTAQMNRESQRSSNFMGAQGINAGVAGNNAAMNQQNALGVIGMGSSLLGGAIGPKSDPLTKILLPAGPAAAAPATGPASAYVLGPQGGVDVMGTMAAINQQQVDAIRNPGSTGGYSDPRAKVPIGPFSPEPPAPVGPGDIVARSTWGPGPGTTAADLPAWREQNVQAANQQAAEQAATDARVAVQPHISITGIKEMAQEDKARSDELKTKAAAYAANDVDMPESEQREMKRLNVRMKQEAKAEKQSDEKKATPGDAVAGMFGRTADWAKSAAANVPTYQPYAGYQAPHLLQIGPGSGMDTKNVLGPMIPSGMQGKESYGPLPSDPDMKRGMSRVMSDPMADANRSMQPSAYMYKPQFKPGEQAPGEVNVGPMADAMAANPVARTAVKVNPQDGMLMIDRDKALKLSMGGIASLQHQVDELRTQQSRRKRA